MNFCYNMVCAMAAVPNTHGYSRISYHVKISAWIFGVLWYNMNTIELWWFEINMICMAMHQEGIIWVYFQPYFFLMKTRYSEISCLHKFETSLQKWPCFSMGTFLLQCCHLQRTNPTSEQRWKGTLGFTALDQEWSWVLTMKLTTSFKYNHVIF